MLRRRNPDREAGRLLTEIYRTHSAGAYRYAYHLTRSREDADDLVQTVFLGLHQALLRGDTIVTPGAFIATAVKRRAINLAARRRDEPDADAVEQAPARAGAADAATELARIQALLYTLPETQHQAFVLRHWSGLSNREIAAVLSTTEPAVESLLVRARAALMAASGSDQECADVCARLAEDRPTPPADAAHITTCRGCRTAQQRLTRATGIAASAVLLPNVHVAHALAAAVPGFNAGAAIGASGGGIAAAAGSKAGAAGLLAKAGAAVVTVTAVTAVGVHARPWAHTPAPPAHAAVAHARPASTPATTSATRPATTAAPGVPAGADGTDASRTTHHAAEAKDARHGSDGGGGGDTSAASGDSNTGSGGDTTSGGGDSGTGSGSTSGDSNSGGDVSGAGSGGGTDSSSAQSGDGSGSGGSSDGSGGSSDGSGADGSGSGGN